MRYTRLKRQIEANSPVALSAEKSKRKDAIVESEALERLRLANDEHGGVTGVKRKREDHGNERERKSQNYEDGKERMNSPLHRSQTSCSQSAGPTYSQDLHPHSQKNVPPQSSFVTVTQQAQARMPREDPATFSEMAHIKNATAVFRETAKMTRSLVRDAATKNWEGDKSSSEDEMPLAKLHKKKSSPLLVPLPSSISNGHTSLHPQHHPFSKRPFLNTHPHPQPQQQQQSHTNFEPGPRSNPLFRNPDPFVSPYPSVHMPSHPHSQIPRASNGIRAAVNPALHGRSFEFPSPKGGESGIISVGVGDASSDIVVGRERGTGGVPHLNGFGKLPSQF